ncbi:MAG: hypothetical protein JWM92_409 [Candidatus Nomurabacteria bacterium]|nr:hypothetical protein [Candidatus Nomurabacteria bacterium]
MKKLLSIAVLIAITFVAKAQKVADTLTDEEAGKIQYYRVYAFRNLMDLEASDYGKINRYVKWLTAVCLDRPQLLPKFLSLHASTAYIFLTEEEEEYEVKTKDGEILVMEYCIEEKRWFSYVVDLNYLQSKKYFLGLLVP